MIADDLDQGSELPLGEFPAVFVNGMSTGLAADGTRIRALIVAVAKRVL